ncbi:hypothetical protein STENM223S_01848 [Streptomyces tendae]
MDPRQREVARHPPGADRHPPDRDRAAAHAGRAGPHPAGRRAGGRRRLRAGTGRRRSQRTPPAGHRYRRGRRTRRGDPAGGGGGARPAHPPYANRSSRKPDRATYERRAVAVERERAIAENELASQIELARREEQLVDQRGTNTRREAEEKAAADGVRTEAGGGPHGPPGPRGGRGRARDGRGARRGPGRLAAGARRGRSGHAARPGGDPAGGEPAADRERHPFPGRAHRAPRQDGAAGRPGGRASGPRAVLVHRRTEYEELLARHGTHGQAAFFLSSRGRSIDEVARRHDATLRALREVASAVPLDLAQHQGGTGRTWTASCSPRRTW